MVLIPGVMYNRHEEPEYLTPAQKSGYLDIKQHSKVRSRKIKVWNRRWAVLTKMADLSSDELAAKLELYDNETKWRSHSSDKITFVLEKITDIRPAKSRTHQFAYTVVEQHQRPMLVLSGSTEEESFSWVLALQEIFTPEQILASKGDYKVMVLAEHRYAEWTFSGACILSVSPVSISLRDLQGAPVLSLGLKTLKRFHVDKCPVTGQKNKCRVTGQKDKCAVGGQKAVLVIECGRNSAAGINLLQIETEEAESIMSSIKQSIFVAMELKEQSVDTVHPSSTKLRVAQSRTSTGDLVDQSRTSTRDLVDWSGTSTRDLVDNISVLPSLLLDGSALASPDSVISKSPAVDMNAHTGSFSYWTRNLHAEEKLCPLAGENEHITWAGQDIIAQNQDIIEKNQCRISKDYQQTVEKKQTAAENQYTAGKNKHTSGENEETTKENQHTFQKNQQTFHDNEQTARENQHATRENKQTSGENQQIPRENGNIIRRNQHATEENQQTTGKNQHACGMYINLKPDDNGKVVGRNEHSALTHIDIVSKSSTSYNNLKDMPTDETPTFGNPTGDRELPKTNVQRLRSVSTVVAAIQARSGHENRRDEFPDDRETTDIDSAIASIISAPNYELFSKKTQNYQSVDLNGNELSRTRGLLNLWGISARQMTQENEYAELEELTVPLLTLDTQQDIRPVLPARPVSINSFSSIGHDSCTNAKESSRSMRHRKSNTNGAQSERTHLHKHVNVEMPCVIRDTGLCDVCGGDRVTTRSHDKAQTWSIQNVTQDSSMYVNDVICTSDVASCIYKSPPKTSVTSSNVFNTHTTDTKIRGVLLHNKLQNPAKPKEFLHDLANNVGKQATCETALVDHLFTSRNATSSLSHPFRRVYPDYTNVEGNPQADKNSPACAASSSCNSDAFMPISSSLLSNQTSAIPQRKREQRSDSVVNLYENDFATFQNGRFDKVTNGRDVSIANACHSNYSRDTRDSVSSRSTTSKYTQTDYIVMMAAPYNWPSTTTTSMLGMRGATTFLEGRQEKSAFLTEQAHSIYVQPNNRPALLKQSRQYQNIY